MASNIVFDGTKGISLPSFTTTEKNAIVSPATGATVFDTTQNRQNVYAGGAWNAGLNSGTAVTASGTGIGFTSLPSWIKRITVMFSGVSTNGTNNPIIQIGSGSYTTTGYAGSASYIGGAITNALNSTGFLTTAVQAATYTHYGLMVLENITGDTWVFSSNTSRGDGAASAVGNGSITLSGALTHLRITTVGGTDTFDAGSINILYE